MSDNTVDLTEFRKQKEELENLFQEGVELHPDLEPYVAVERGWLVLKHPLVFKVPFIQHIESHLANRMYEHKQEALRRAVNKEDWHSYVYLHERPHRLEAFLEGVLENSTIYDHKDLFLDIWSDTEFPHHLLDEWTEAWSYFDDEDGLVPCNADDADAFRQLRAQSSVPIYRGVSGIKYPMGLSWTVDYDRAEWFSRRFAGMVGEKPHVYHGEVRGQDILTYTNARGEQEVVVLPGDVEILK